MTVHKASGRSYVGLIKGVSLGPKMLQSVPELLPCPVDVGLHRAQGQVQHGRDLLVRPTLDVTEHDTGSVLGAESRNRTLNGRAELPRFHFLEGGLTPRFDVERGGLDLGARGRVG